jgi:hypothetical protein
MFLANPSSAPEARQRIALGDSRGLSGKTSKATTGAKESSSIFFLSPLPGLVDFATLIPRLSPWAILFRRSAAGSKENGTAFPSPFHRCFFDFVTP